MTTDNEIQSSNSINKIYAWFNNGTIYYWSSAPYIFANEDASYMFSHLENVTSIDTSFKTNKSQNLSYLFCQFE